MITQLLFHFFSYSPADTVIAEQRITQSDNNRFHISVILTQLVVRQLMTTGRPVNIWDLEY